MKNRYVKRKLPEGVSVSEDRIRSIAAACRTYPVLVYTLLVRGFSEEEAERLLSTQTSVVTKPLHCADKAAKKILEHLKQNDSIRIFADYDCDGITSGYVMFHGLQMIRDKLGSTSKIEIHYPQRKEGYGLNVMFCMDCIKQNVDFVITVDNGITRREEVNMLLAADIDVLITDHHEPQKEHLPECLIVNPCYNDRSRSYLAGVAVAWNVINTTDREANTGIATDILIPAVTTGTIGDCMPLSFENAEYIKEGLKQINEGRAPKILLQLKQDSCKDMDCSVTDISFSISPKINAASRMGDVRIGAAGFYTDDDKKIREVAEALSRLNDERRDLTKEARKKVKQIILPPSDRIVAVNGEEFGTGIAGIIAGEIAKEYPDYPAFVYHHTGNGTLAGSVRCNNEGLDLMGMFQALIDRRLLVKAAGHAAACVVEVEEEQLEDFVDTFSEMFDSIDIPAVVRHYDSMASLRMLNNKLLEQINRIPYTTQDQPVFIVPHVLISEVRPSKSNPDNLRFRISDNTDSRTVWGWGFRKRYLDIGAPTEVNLVCELCQDFMRSYLSATLRIIDMLPVKKGRNRI